MGYRQRVMLRSILDVVVGIAGDVANNTTAIHNLRAEVASLKKETNRMADEENALNQAVTQLTTDVTDAATELQLETQKILDAINNPAGVDPAVVQSAANTIGQLSSSLHDAVAAAKVVTDNPTPNPTPIPDPVPDPQPDPVPPAGRRR